jgi:hypothetical protein
VNFKNKKTMYIVLILITIGIVLFNYQNSEKTEDVKSSANNLTLNNGITGKEENITSGDQYFKERISMNYQIIGEDLTRIRDNAKIKNFSIMESSGKFLRDDSNMLLGQVNEFNVYSYQNAILDEYKKSLNEYNTAGLYLEDGSRGRNMTEMNDSIAHIQNGTYYEYRVLSMLYGNNTISAKTVIG